jgi:tetratricopeptide (TPR) repeat protein
VPGLKVIARSSSFGFKGQDVDVRTIADKLGVTTLLEGSVRRDGGRLRLSARLIDGATGGQLWSGSFDRELTDIFAVQAELASAIVQAIVPAASGSPAEDAAAPTTDLDAYDLYLASRGQFVVRTPNGIKKALDLAEQAVRLDPDFARAQAHLANTLIFEIIYNDEDAQRSAALLKRAEAAAHRALSLDPELSEAHGAYANLLRTTERSGAGEQYQRALELNPNNAAGWHDYAVYLGNSGRHEESVRATARALELDPRQPVTWANHLGNMGWDPRDPRYLQEFERAIRTVGDLPFAIDRMTMPELSSPGFPVEVLRAAQLKQRNPSADNLPTWINRYRAWLAVDPQRARQALPASADVMRHGQVDMEGIRLFLAADIAGVLGDWPGVDHAIALLRAREWADESRIASVEAFWRAVQGRPGEAAAALAQAEPMPETAMPPVLGGDATYGMVEAAQLRIYRATGREADAARLATTLLERLRTDRQSVGEGCLLDQRRFDGWMRHASLAANEGFKDEAVDALAGAMRCGELPPGFLPDLPWFRALDGYAPYEELKRERERRIERIRPELVRIENEAALEPPVQPPPMAG